MVPYTKYLATPVPNPHPRTLDLNFQTLHTREGKDETRYHFARLQTFQVVPPGKNMLGAPPLIHITCSIAKAHTDTSGILQRPKDASALLEDPRRFGDNLELDLIQNEQKLMTPQPGLFERLITFPIKVTTPSGRFKGKKQFFSKVPPNTPSPQTHLQKMSISVFFKEEVCLGGGGV